MQCVVCTWWACLDSTPLAAATPPPVLCSIEFHTASKSSTLSYYLSLVCHQLPIPFPLQLLLLLFFPSLLSPAVLLMLVSQLCWSCSLLSSSSSVTTMPPAWHPQGSMSSLPLCRCVGYLGGSWLTRSSVSGW